MEASRAGNGAPGREGDFLDGPAAGLYDVIHRRRDVRAEFSGEPVPAPVLHRLLDAAHCAPSVGLTQPWDFVLVTDPDLRRTFWQHVQDERQVFADALD